MKRPDWFERTFQFGFPPGELPFFLERLEGTIARLEKYVGMESDTVLSYQPEGKWSIKQHIGHLAEVDGVALKRIEEVVNQISPMTPAVFEPKQNYNDQRIDHVLEYFIRNRKANLQRYNMLNEADCTKTSLHPRLKLLMNPVDLAYFDAEHDDHHLVRIREIQEAFNR